MKTSINNFILKRKHSCTSKQTDLTEMKIVHNRLEITLKPLPMGLAKDISKDTRTLISGKNILVLNLNHPHAYGHIYTELFSELYAVDETYSEYDCILTLHTPLMQKIIEFFNLKLSNKIKFIDTKSTETYSLQFEQLELANHFPRSYINKQKNVLKLKAEFHNLKPIANTSKNFVVFCSRSTKWARNGRNITKETEKDVVEYLKQYSAENNLEFYFLTGEEPDGSNTPLAKQYELFSNAKIVVGPHGGVFSNLIFLDPTKKPKIIEFCPDVGKSFRKLFDGAIDAFAEYHQIFLIPPPEVIREVGELSGYQRTVKLINILKKVDSSINLSELERALPLKHSLRNNIK